MKKTRILAWLLVVAMLTLGCPALGEALDIELPESGVAEQPAGIELDGEEDALGITDSDGVGELSLDLPDLDLPDALEVELDSGAPANGATGEGRFEYCQPQGSWDNDALFAGYVDLLFGKRDPLGLKPNAGAGEQLTGLAADLYSYLTARIKKVAAGTLSDTRFYFPESVVPVSKMETACELLPTIVNALLLDYPYHLFWYEKTRSFWYGYDEDGVYLFLPVAEGYAAGDYETDVNGIAAAQVAVSTAKKLVKKYAGKSDYEKLCGYRDYILDAVEYNHDAAGNMYGYDNNAWQLIWVLDGNPETNVVCEGYAKAFQYLCDLTDFNSAIQCHIAYGYEYEGSGDGGGHMWNIVTMGNGRNYHVDVTFIDGGFDELFLCGAEATQYEDGYCVLDRLYYTFDPACVNLYPARVLKLSTSDFDPDSYEESGDGDDGDDDAPTAIAIDQGKSATLYMGNKLTLTASLTPADSKASLTWKSSKNAVATVSDKGVVTPKKAGNATITVATDNGLSAKITVKVVDASGVTLKKGNTTLKKGQSISLARGKSLTLKGVVTPAKVKTKLTWTSSDKSVTVKNGKVTVGKSAKVGAKVKITVKTANKKSSYVYIVVK